MTSSHAAHTHSLTPQAAMAEGAAQGAAVHHARLDNGMELVVIPDHRAPVVTHMVWYRNGSADDPVGKSGIAHFLEHLMFKGTKSFKQGHFSELVAELGGQENAFTSNDFTAYFQRIPKDCLDVMMRYEADRMTGLVLSDEVVAPERDVVLEERRMRTDSSPSQQLSEAVSATLYPRHPYGAPVIGWGHEIETLDRHDALAYYARFYTPENAILIVAGDVEPDAVEAMARSIYGAIPARGEAPRRARPQEPEPRAHRLVTLADPKVEQPTQSRVFLVPSYATAAPGEAEALEVLGHMLGGGQTSLLYKALVLDQQIALNAGAYYIGQSLDQTRLMTYALPAPGVTLDALDAATEAVINAVAADGVSETDLARAKTRLIADAVYAQDSQSSLARWYGVSLTTGQTVEDVAAWPDRIDAVTADAVQAVAAKWLKRARSVSGYLLPQAA